MNRSIQTASAAIARSISHNEIVTIDWTVQLAADLHDASDDSVDTGDTVEYWGEIEGEHWRVHLIR